MGKADLFFNLGIKVIQHAGEFVTDANSRERLARNFLAASRSLRDSGERGLEQVQLENLQQIALGDEIKLFAPEK